MLDYNCLARLIAMFGSTMPDFKRLQAAEAEKDKVAAGAASSSLKKE